MIQRIQTVYLIAIIILVSIMCTGSLLSMKQQNATNGIDEYDLNIFHFKHTEVQNAVIDGKETQTSTLKVVSVQYGLIAIAAILIGLTLTIILSFKNREKQIKLTRLNFLVMSMLYAALFAKAINYMPGFEFSKLMPYSSIGVILMIFNLYLNWRVLRLIKKDDELVKSADRIR
ncbi:MAG: DUF4293 domain-containing protein [Bacteroidota bacterium]